MLVKIIKRAKDLISKGVEVKAATEALNFFLQNQNINNSIDQHLDQFCLLDDYDIMCTIKNWSTHPDKILSILSSSLVDRNLFKVKLQTYQFDEVLIDKKKKEIMQKMNISKEDADYFIFTGEAINTMYNPYDEKINILFKDGKVKDISQVDNTLIDHNLSRQVKKFYICYLR